VAPSFETHRFTMLLGTRSFFLMARSAATPRVSNHETHEGAIMVRLNRKRGGRKLPQTPRPNPRSLRGYRLLERVETLAAIYRTRAYCASIFLIYYFCGRCSSVPTSSNSFKGIEVISRLLSCPAHAGHPVHRDARKRHHRPCLLDHPLSRMMTAERTTAAVRRTTACALTP
jgi:hypothetical protein